LWESARGEVKVFSVVPGVTLTGTMPPDSELRLSTTVTLAGSGRSVPYRRRVQPEDDGAFSLVLAHPGEYDVNGGDETLTIEEVEVVNGAKRELKQ
jgi:dolichyl-diphosphooligosaccharide--protein glycosyltransferase